MTNQNKAEQFSEKEAQIEAKIDLLERLANHYKEEIKGYLQEKKAPLSTFNTKEEHLIRLSAIEETIRIAGITKEQIIELRKQAKQDYEKTKK